MKIFDYQYMLNVSRCLIIIVLFLLEAVFFPDQPAQAKQYLEFIVENETYAKNLEHTKIDEFNEGQTFIGDIIKSYLRYTPKKRVTIETGILFGVPFGADDTITPNEPIISLHLDFEHGLRITAGTLDRQHPLLDAFFNDDLDYTEPIEQGFQFKADNKYLKQDLWVSWEVEETSTRPEEFSIGNFTQLNYRGLMLDGQVYWVHHGGQMNQQDLVSNNLSLGAGIGYSIYPRKRKKLKFIDEIGATLHYLYNYDEPSGNVPKLNSNGVIGKLFIKFKETEWYYQQWWSKSNDFKPEKGDPLYQAKDYMEFGVEKIFSIGEGIFLTTAFKGQWVDGQFVQIEHVWVSWQAEFSLFKDYFKGVK